MAHTSFFTSWEEIQDIFALLLEHGSWFVPEKNPDRPEPIELRSCEAITAHLTRVGHPERLFVMSERWSVAPLVFEELDSKGYHYFYVVLGHGGPAFELFPPALVRDGTFTIDYQTATVDVTGQRLVAASLQDRAIYYRNPDAVRVAAARGHWADDDILPRPPSMDEAHRAVRRLARRRATRSANQTLVGPTISPGALDLYSRGVSFDGYHPRPLRRR